MQNYNGLHLFETRLKVKRSQKNVMDVHLDTLTQRKFDPD